RAAAHRGRGWHADRRAVRAHATGAQRAVGAERRSALALRDLRVPSQTAVPPRRAVHQRDRRRRSHCRCRAPIAVGPAMTHLRQGYGGQALLARWRVTLGFVFAAIVLWLGRPSLQSLTIGAPSAVRGGSLRLWARGHLEKSKEVTQSGP